MTKQQQRDRAERRRKLEEFWRWVLSEKPDVIRIEKAGYDLIPELCNKAIVMARDELYAARQRTGTELHRDLSLAQLEVLEMLEERVGESRQEVEEDHQEHWAGQPYDVVSIGGRSSGKTEYLELYQRFEGSNEITLHQTRVTYERLQHPLSKPYDPRKDLFFRPEVADKHPWEFK